VNREHIEGLASDQWAAFLADDLLPWVFDDEIDLGANALEIGPGPGRTTDLLSARHERLTAVEVDEELASNLAKRFGDGSNVSVHHADAAEMPFGDASFSGACCFIMLHHVPTPEHQDRLFAEVKRVLAPGATFIGADASPSDELASRHLDDTYNPVDPSTLEPRLARAGFVDVRVVERPGLFKFAATAPG
jgi:SAM-dependent methyltransferase